MSDTPSVSELVAAVRMFLGEAEGQLSGRLAFHAKVAGNVLAIVERELANSPAPIEAAVLTMLTGRDAPLAAQRADLCAQLRDGRADADTPGLLDALLEATLAQVAVDNPRYATFKRLKGLA